MALPLARDMEQRERSHPLPKPRKFAKNKKQLTLKPVIRIDNSRKFKFSLNFSKYLLKILKNYSKFALKLSKFKIKSFVNKIFKFVQTFTIF